MQCLQTPFSATFDELDPRRHPLGWGQQGKPSMLVLLSCRTSLRFRQRETAGMYTTPHPSLEDPPCLRKAISPSPQTFHRLLEEAVQKCIHTSAPQ
jgi:hypothetical protein